MRTPHKRRSRAVTRFAPARAWLAPAVFALGLGAWGCRSNSNAASSGSPAAGAEGGGSPSAGFCEGLSQCPNDPPLNLDRCQQQIAGKCGEQGKSALLCMQTNQVCGADGHTNYLLASQRCTKEWQTFYTCMGGAAPGTRAPSQM